MGFPRPIALALAIKPTSTARTAASGITRLMEPSLHEERGFPYAAPEGRGRHSPQASARFDPNTVRPRFLSAPRREARIRCGRTDRRSVALALQDEAEPHMPGASSRISGPSGRRAARRRRVAAGTPPPPRPQRVPPARAGARAGSSGSPAIVATSRRPPPRRALRPARRARSRARCDARRRGPGARDRLRWRRKYASPLGRSRAGGRGAAGARNAGSSRVRIHASPIGVRTGVSDPAARRTPRRPLPARSRPTWRTPRASRDRRRAGTGARARDERRSGSTSGARHGPDRRLSRAVPADQDRARRRGVAQRFGLHAEPASGLAVAHPPAVEEGVQAGGDVLCALPAAGVVRQPPEREDRAVARRHDVRAEPRPPDLDERRILPGRRLGPLDPRVDREERGARHAVLQARPRRTPERARAGWEPLVERADAPSEREDLRPREVEPRPRQVRPRRGRSPEPLDPWGRRAPRERSRRVARAAGAVFDDFLAAHAPAEPLVDDQQAQPEVGQRIAGDHRPPARHPENDVVAARAR